MDYLQQSFSVHFEYKVYFTEDVFDPSNSALKDYLLVQPNSGQRKLLFVIDKGVLEHHPELPQKIRSYFAGLQHRIIEEILILKGGEEVKNDEGCFYKIVDAVNKYGIDRHSYIVGIGGGSVLDVTGYAAAVSHRGIRHIRIPTTVLSQNDSGVGVKNGINYFKKKNFLGTFAPPVAVFNDARFLETLSSDEWRSGMSEAIKVALVKDAPFFEWLEQHAAKLASRDMAAMTYLIRRCAELHLQHIASRDPFEMGSSRPLDFGHWSAHKLEQLTGFSIRHGDAVAMGIALDSTYSFLAGRLSQESFDRIIRLLVKLGFSLLHPFMEIRDEDSPILRGLDEFREHLGGKLTIMLLNDIGVGEEVNELNTDTICAASNWLKQNSY